MKFGPNELFRVAIIFIISMFFLNIGIIGYRINEANSFQNEASQIIAKEGAVDHVSRQNILNLAKKQYPALIYHSSSKSSTWEPMFTIEPAKSEKVPIKNINGNDTGKKMTIDYREKQNYGRPIKYVIHMSVPSLVFSDYQSIFPKVQWSRDVTTTSQIPQQNLARQQQQF